LQIPGLHGEQPLYTRIEEMAAYYVESLRAAQPEGPYFLGGWSLGGTVAYEMAQQLTARGQKVSQLLILDTSAWNSPVENFDDRIEDPLEIDERLLRDLLHNAQPVLQEELQCYQGVERIEYLVRKAKSLNLFPPDLEIAEVRFFLEVFKVNARAKRQYIPKSYPGSVTLFKTAREIEPPPADWSERTEWITKRGLDPTMGWGDLAASGVRVIDIPGTHATMLNDPNVETLAAQIRACLDDALKAGKEPGPEFVAANTLRQS
jgi:thioesterase domain-containing protein